MNRRTWMAALLVGLAGWSTVSLAQSGRAAKEPVAVVYGVKIHAHELTAILKASGPTPVHLPAAQRRQHQLEALGLLIDNVLIRHHLEKQKIPVIPPIEVSRRLNEMRLDLEKQKKSLEEFCKETHQTEDQLKISIADHLQWSAYIARHISDSVAEKYFNDNRDFFDKVTVEASHIVYRVPQSAPENEKKEARDKLKKIREQLLSDPKVKFADLARKYSQDPRAAQGGELGEFPRRWVFDEPFSKAAFALKVGEISDVVETDFGYHLIQVTKRNPGTPADFSKIKEAVREFCAEDWRQQILAREREEAHKSGKIQINLTALP